MAAVFLTNLNVISGRERTDVVPIQRAPEQELKQISLQQLGAFAAYIEDFRPFYSYNQYETILNDNKMYRARATFVSGGAFNIGDWQELIVITSDIIPYDNTFSGLTATTVQDAIDEVDQTVDDHIGATSSAHASTAISYSNVTSGLLATDAQAAIDEVAATVVGGIVYRGSWDVPGNAVTGDALNTSLTKGVAPDAGGGDPTGFTYVVSVPGLLDLTDAPGDENWEIGDSASWSGTAWTQIKANPPVVASVFGRIGAIVAEDSDYTQTLVPDNFRSVNTDVTLTATDEYAIYCDATPGQLTVTLPDLTTAVVGADSQRFRIKKIDTSVNDVLIVPSGADLIEGDTEVRLSGNARPFAELSSDGTNWYLVN